MKIVSNQLFNLAFLAIILTHSYYYITYPLRSSFVYSKERIFIHCYIVECSLKIIAFGFKNYFKVGWNIIDFWIIISFAFQDSLSNIFGNLNFGAFRIIRVLRVLPIKDLQYMVKALILVFPAILQVLIIFLIFGSIYALIGLNLFAGELKYRCVNFKYGVPYEEKKICGNSKCKQEFSMCIKTLNNPDRGMTSFDNFISALIQVLRIITLEEWTNIMNMTQDAWHDSALLYFVNLAILGNFFLIRLIKAVMKVKILFYK